MPFYSKVFKMSFPQKLLNRHKTRIGRDAMELFMSGLFDNVSRKMKIVSVFFFFFFFFFIFPEAIFEETVQGAAMYMWA